MRAMKLVVPIVVVIIAVTTMHGGKHTWTTVPVKSPETSSGPLRSSITEVVLVLRKIRSEILSISEELTGAIAALAKQEWFFIVQRDGKKSLSLIPSR